MAASSARRRASREPRRVAVLGGNRIPFARSNGPYALASNQDMLTAALDGLVARFGLAGERVGEVVAGAVLKHSRDFNLTRETVLGSRLHPTTPAYDVQQACGTGLEAAILVTNKIALGQIDSGIAGGVDSASDAPIAVSEGLRQGLLAANRAQGTGAVKVIASQYLNCGYLPLMRIRSVCGSGAVTPSKPVCRRSSQARSRASGGSFARASRSASRRRSPYSFMPTT